jgi:acyl-CoA thioester hydrolase
MNYTFIVKEMHLDTFGHVNNATYLTLFEEARWDLITKNGYGLDKIKASGLGPTILEIHIKYLRELRLGEKIIIETRLLSYENKIGKLQQQMLRDSELCCTMEMTFGLFDMKTRKLVLPTPEWLAAMRG